MTDVEGIMQVRPRPSRIYENHDPQ